MAELIGAILGDGNLYDKGPFYVEFCGNPLTDLEYFRNVLLPIVRNETGLSPRLFVRSHGLRFKINSKSFVEWLKTVGVPAGEAKRLSGTPSFICSEKDLMTRCVRGLHDTDGSVYFDLRQVYSAPYPRIELHMRNVELVHQVSDFFRSICITHSFVKNKNSTEASGVAVMKEFLQKIGFSNAYHVSRIEKYYPGLVRLNCCPTSYPAKIRSDFKGGSISRRVGPA